VLYNSRWIEKNKYIIVIRIIVASVDEIRTVASIKDKSVARLAVSLVTIYSGTGTAGLLLVKPFTLRTKRYPVREAVRQEGNRHRCVTIVANHG